MSAIDWRVRRFAELSILELYGLMKLRVDVFVVEQACSYAELDGLDSLPDALHILGCRDGQIIAYARALPPGASGKAPASITIGRVVVAKDYRGKDVAASMLGRLLAVAAQKWPDADMALSAQIGVSSLYEGFGFVSVSAAYVEDGIPHIDMRR